MDNMAEVRREGLPLQIYKKKTDLENVGIVLNIPPRSSDVKALISSSLGATPTAVHFHPNNYEVALAVFQQPVASIQSTGNGFLSILPVSEPRGIVVDITDFDEPYDVLTYFDSQQSIIEGDYEFIDVYPDIAILKLPDPELVLPEVFAKTHKVNGCLLYIEPYYSEFYDEVVKSYISKPTRYPDAAVRSGSPKPTVCWFPECSNTQTMSHSQTSSRSGYGNRNAHAQSSARAGDQRTQELDIDTICKGDSDRKLLSRILFTPKGERFIKSFEKHNKCRLDIQFITKEKRTTRRNKSFPSDTNLPTRRGNVRGNNAGSRSSKANQRSIQENQLKRLISARQDMNLALSEMVPELKPVTQALNMLAMSTMDEIDGMSHTSSTGVRKNRPTQTSATASVNGVQVISKLGSIAKVKADVLVSVVGPNKDFMESVISRSMVQLGGQDLHRELKAAASQATSSRILQTQGHNLKCSRLFTLVLDPWQGQATEQKHSQIIADVFRSVVSLGFSSVSLPLIGCGNMLQYPVDKVISTILSEAFKASHAGGLQKITIMAYEENHYRSLAKELTSHRIGIPPGTEARHQRAPANSDDVISCTMSLTAHRKYLSSIIRKLQNETRQSFLFSLKVMNPRKNGLSLRMKGKVHEVTKIPTLRMVGVEIDSRRGDVDITGDRDDVYTCKQDIENLFVSGQQAMIRELQCIPEIWLSLAFDQPQTPPYWTSVPNSRPIPDLFRSGRLRTPFALQPVEPHIDQGIRKLVKNTWQSSNVGVGRDAVNLTHNDIRIKKIERIENLDLFEKYAKKRQEYFRVLSEKDEAYSQLEDLPVQNGGPILSTEALDDCLKEDLFPEINEHYMFHGTKPDIIETVIHQGLDFRMSSDKAMFGMGIYGAESPTKADQYVDSKQNRTAGEKKMLLVRMILGQPYICADLNPRKYRRPPCLKAGCRRDDCIDTHGRFDSVIGDGPWLFREFVIYAVDQSYPEYLITYYRV